MPNNITNKLELIGKQSDVENLVESLSTYIGERFTFPDFNKIIPMPESLLVEESNFGDVGLRYLIDNAESTIFKKEIVKPSDEAIELGKKYLRNIADYGFKTWYKWAIKNWQTKWNAYACSKKNDTEYYFETAWSSVPNLIKKISETNPNVKIIYKWADENTGFNCGILVFHKGEQNGGFFTPESNEAYELAFELNPVHKEQYKFINGKYEYIEEE